MERPEAARTLLERRPAIQRIAVRLISGPGRRLLSAAGAVGALFPLIAGDVSLFVQLLPATLASCLWLLSGVVAPYWRWLAGAAVPILGAVSIALVTENGTWSEGWALISGLSLLAVVSVAGLILSNGLGPGSPTAREAASP